jgi:hypothetical protein
MHTESDFSDGVETHPALGARVLTHPMEHHLQDPA